MLYTKDPALMPDLFYVDFPWTSRGSFAITKVGPDPETLKEFYHEVRSYYPH